MSWLLQRQHGLVVVTSLWVDAWVDGWMKLASGSNGQVGMGLAD